MISKDGKPRGESALLCAGSTHKRGQFLAPLARWTPVGFITGSAGCHDMHWTSRYALARAGAPGGSLCRGGWGAPEAGRRRRAPPVRARPYQSLVC